jgi:hypothetical protein
MLWMNVHQSSDALNPLFCGFCLACLSSSTLIAGMKFDRTFCFFRSLYDGWESPSSVIWWLREERCVWRIPAGVDQGTHVSEDPSGINPDTMVWNRFFHSQTPSLIWVAAFDKDVFAQVSVRFFSGLQCGCKLCEWGDFILTCLKRVFFCHWVLFFLAVCRSRSKIVRWVCSTAAAAARGRYSIRNDSASVPLLCFRARGPVFCPPTTGSSRRR